MHTLSSKPATTAKPATNKPAPILTIKNLSVAFSGKTVVDHISLKLYAGETLALVGESGSGKSVSAHSILKLLPYPNACHPSGEILFNGIDLLQQPESLLKNIRGHKIGMIFQEPMTALNPLHSVEKQISEVLTVHYTLSPQQCREKTLTLLHKVQIPNPETRLKSYPHELSGGQRQRVMIAMALANHPEILIADEPTTALDVSVQREILQLLQDIQRSDNMAILLITHDLGIVRHYSNNVCVMKAGKIVEDNSCKDLFTSPKHPYTQALLNSNPEGSAVTIDLPAMGSDSQSQSPVLTTRGLSVKYPLHKPLFRAPSKFLHALKPIDLEIQRGTTLGIVGESGSGKTTLAMAILRLIPSQGEIHYRQQDLNQLKQKQLLPFRKHLQPVFQDPFASLSPRMTAGDIIAEGLQVHTELCRQEREQEVIKTMNIVGLDVSMRHRYPHEFSGGQRQRIAIARALILKPEVIVLDEPTSALDRAVQVQVITLLKQLQQRLKLTYIFISHDLQVIKALSHRIIVMRDGSVVEQGKTSDVLAQPQHVYTQALLEAAFFNK